MSYKTIPTYENGQWSETVFQTRQDFTDFITNKVFIEEGPDVGYDFDDVTLEFNREAQSFQKNGYYCNAPRNTKDFITYWDTQKDRCRFGVIYKSGNKIWYLDGFYYMWLNFMPIYDKLEKRFDFPKIWDGQYHMSLYELLAELNWKHSVVLKKRQFGSEQPHTEPVLGEKGWYTMGELKEGDRIWNPDGTLTSVIFKFRNGLKDVYTFTLSDGRKIRCGIDHNWLVYDRSVKKEKILTTKDLLKIGLLSPPVTTGGRVYNNYRFSVPPIKPIDFCHSQDPEIDPYILGTKTHIKYIPEEVQNASLSYRIKVLQGLMDSDGYVNSKGLDIHYTSCNRILAEGVELLSRSLGIKSQIYDTTIEGKIYYRLRMSGNIEVPLFSLSRKKERFDLRKSKNISGNTSIVSITKEEYQEDSSCIVVDNPNHLYITTDYTTTHNTYFHMAKLINKYWFEEGAVLKVGASFEGYINEKGAWKFLDEYNNFLNSKTAWYRPSNPSKPKAWKQQVETTMAQSRRKVVKGNKSTINAYSFEKSPTNGVGGPVTYFYHEESGIAPRLMETYEYIRPALQSGLVTTGMFIAAGSVGDLDQCQPLKELMLKPDNMDIFSVKTNLLDTKGTIGRSGLFIPEQWSMPPFIDKYGNSQVKEALEALRKLRAEWKITLTPEIYQLRISQKPTNIEEAFASRNEPIFPIHLVTSQLKKIEGGEYPVEYVTIEKEANNKYHIKRSNKLPINQFPVPKALEDKTGVICMYERPIENTPWGTYYASIDPVSEGKTSTSDSLCSIIVYRNDLEITNVDDQGVPTTSLRPGAIVCTWTGRFDDINRTHERLEAIIEVYNAWTLCEANVSEFIQYMIRVRKQKFLVAKDQIPFLSEAKSNLTTYQVYGWKNTGTLFKQHLLSYGLSFIKEEINMEYNEAGDPIPGTGIMGITRIPDPMLLTEMKEYEYGLNVDRLVTYCALVAFVQIMNNNLQIIRRVVVNQDKLVNPQKMSKLSMRSPFRHLGNSQSVISNRPKSSPFRNIR